jgi:hypothetical protein
MMCSFARCAGYLGLDLPLGQRSAARPVSSTRAPSSTRRSTRPARTASAIACSSCQPTMAAPTYRRYRRGARPVGCGGLRRKVWPRTPLRWPVTVVERHSGALTGPPAVLAVPKASLERTETECPPPSACSHGEKSVLLKPCGKAELVVAKSGQCVSKGATAARSAAPRSRPCPCPYFAIS